MDRFKTSDVIIPKNGDIRYPIEKSIFAINFPLKLFRVTVVNVGIESLKSLHTFLKNILYHMPLKFELNRMVLCTRQKPVFF